MVWECEGTGGQGSSSAVNQSGAVFRTNQPDIWFFAKFSVATTLMLLHNTTGQSPLHHRSMWISQG